MPSNTASGSKWISDSRPPGFTANNGGVAVLRCRFILARYSAASQRVPGEVLHVLQPGASALALFMIGPFAFSEPIFSL